MARAIHRRRLIEVLAYIYSHRKNWLQNCWQSTDMKERRPTCGTFGCAAGHLAITLNPSKPVVHIPVELWSKPIDERTPKERERVFAAHEFGDYVLANSSDNPRRVEERQVLGKDVKVVHVKYRAQQLLGGLVDPDSSYGLFGGTNKWSDMLRIGADTLGITQKQLREEVEAVIKARGWDKRADEKATV